MTGIPFDLMHGGGNFLAALLLYRPLRPQLLRGGGGGRALTGPEAFAKKGEGPA